MNKLITAKTKVNYNDLRKITLNLNINDRKISTIKKLYNEHHKINPISDSTVYNTISKKMYFKYRKCDFKSKKYFEIF